MGHCAAIVFFCGVRWWAVIDIVAQFPFTYLAVANGVRNAMEWRDCYASVHWMHIWTASIETQAVQWMFRHPDGPVLP